MLRPEVKITHPDRVLFPGSTSQKGITKRDLADYYQEVATEGSKGGTVTFPSDWRDNAIREPT